MQNVQQKKINTTHVKSQTYELFTASSSERKKSVLIAIYRQPEAFSITHVTVMNELQGLECLKQVNLDILNQGSEHASRTKHFSKKD